ncbi:hypothetical protein AK830_g2784 [Neonectria ditissima]|uniref:Xylanolytic transcriptional activator regulatory domain-containing protein n=1 Tax=Neonectria ditissima TaxID=78410 RepID=A0A0P7BAL5_9HYPO|nr:hypothetical protein AK830_g2784 [Neonectria ditissima]
MTSSRPSASGSSAGRFEDIEGRLRAIEAQLWRNTSINQSAMDTDDDDQYVGASFGAHSPTPSSVDTPASLQPRKLLQLAESTEEEELPLPPRHEVDPLVDYYFEDFNQAMPIFHQEDFLAMVEDWYEIPSQRDQASWSAINVVIALSLRHNPSRTKAGDEMASTCIRNAQSAMDSLVYRDQDMKGLQVLLGLALLFLGTAHPHPACVLLATAVKLAHRLKLHRKGQLDAPGNSLEQQRLFWITYIIDRTISLHTTEPYLLRDVDMDIDIKEIQNTDTLYIAECDEVFDFFHVRVNLAFIQGKVYDHIYSVRASKLSTSQKQAATDRLDWMLNEWYKSVPECFTYKNAVKLDPSSQRHCISLHMAYYQCIFSSRRANAHDKPWVKQLIDFSDTISNKGKVATDSHLASPLLPSNWPSLVEAARSCLALSDLIDDGDSALRWSATCACQAAITVLAAQNLTLSQHYLHDQIEEDGMRIQRGIEQLEKNLCDAKDPYLNTIHSVCSDLGKRAALAVVKFHENAAAGGSFWDDELVLA